MSSSRSRFTLIELILVVAIVAVIALITYVAIHPRQELSAARDASRKSDINIILSAVLAYTLDNKGNLPPDIPTGAPKPICQSDVPPETCASTLDGVNLTMLTDGYLKAIPKDPSLTLTGTGTRYTIMQDIRGRIVVAAPGAERVEKIEVMR